jgi:hypothetical protein
MVSEHAFSISLHVEHWISNLFSLDLGARLRCGGQPVLPPPTSYNKYYDLLEHIKAPSFFKFAHILCKQQTTVICLLTSSDILTQHE